MEDVASLGNMMEEIKVNLPRFDQCISLLRTEINELKAGKLDHRLREVTATPLVDPILHSALCKAVDGGLSLPPAPSLSDSEGEEEQQRSSREGVKSEEAEEDGGACAVDEGAASREVAASDAVQIKQQNEPEAVVGEGEGEDEAGRRRQRGEESGLDGAHWRESSGGGGAGRQANTAKPATAAPQKPGKKGQRVASHGSARQKTANGRPPSTSAPPDTNEDGGGDGNNNSSSSNDNMPVQNGTPGGSRASPLRDRPPIPSQGGSRVVPAAPPPTATPSSPSSSNGAASGGEGRRGSSSKNDERGEGGRGGADSTSSRGTEGGLAAATAAAAAAAAGVSPGRSADTKNSGGGGSGSGDGANGKEQDGGSSSKRGRKRPRVGGDGSGENSACDRRPRSKREGEHGRDEEEDGAKDDEEAAKRRADSADAEHFRRIALEVWDRVYKHKFAVIFRKAVNPKDAPGYEKVIKKPMDLSLIRQRIMSGALLSLDDMSRDLFVMCNNAMVFNGKGDPYFDYSKELRTFANEVIEEARRPGFVTADPGFDSVVAGARTSRARQPDPPPAAANRSAPRGRGHQRGGGSSGRKSSRESDSASVADNTGDEGSKGRRGGGGSRLGGGSGSADDQRKRGTPARKAAGKVSGTRGGKSQAANSEAESVEVAGDNGWPSSAEEEDKEEGAGGRNARVSDGGAERGGKKRRTVGKGKQRAREGTDGSSEEETSSRGKSRKPTKPTAKQKAKSKARVGKKRTR